MFVKEQAWGQKAHGNATIGTAAVLLRAKTASRISFMMKNNGPGNVFLGTSAVTTANTVPIASGGSIILDKSVDDIYAVADAASTVVVFLEEISSQITT